jgi:hypothetical protein
VCDDGQGNLAIIKLLPKKIVPFLQSTYSKMTRSTFLGGGAAPSTTIVGLVKKNVLLRAGSVMIIGGDMCGCKKTPLLIIMPF